MIWRLRIAGARAHLVPWKTRRRAVPFDMKPIVTSALIVYEEEAQVQSCGWSNGPRQA